jgi:deoxyribodipyrimidine photo-lyase
LHHSLAALDRQLRLLGCKLIIRSGASLVELEQIIKTTNATSVYWNNLYEPAARKRDSNVQSALQEDGIEVLRYNSSLLFEPGHIQTNDEKPYTVFTPFWRKALTQLHLQPPRPAPRAIPTIAGLRSLPLETLQLLPAIPWDKNFYSVWTPGEDGGHTQLTQFIEQCISNYQVSRDRPDQQGTSRVSPHLHFGELSPQQIVWAANQASIAAPGADTGVEVFVREIGWREFAHHLLFHFPHTAEQPLRQAFAHFPWKHGDGDDFQAWCQGNTGIPLVDAGMRELWNTGWMHNRVRMITASFLTKNQLISWRAGAAWFWNTLVDADLANNTLGWQWTAGCGADAAPFFRIFNPVSQGERFDPDEAYIKKWCPELAALPAGTAHAPWKLGAKTDTSDIFRAAINYPQPIVDLAQSRRDALEAWQRIRS